MILKILRLTLHSDAPMHGDAAKLRGFFATSFNEYALLHQHITDKLVYRYPLIQYKVRERVPRKQGLKPVFHRPFGIGIVVRERVSRK